MKSEYNHVIKDHLTPAENLLCALFALSIVLAVVIAAARVWDKPTVSELAIAMEAKK